MVMMTFDKGKLDLMAIYLCQCRVKSLAESQDVHVPPSAGEAIQLIRFLKDAGVKPLVIGSVGVLSYLNVDPTKNFRPTVDLDLWVEKVPRQLPRGWTIDHEAIGVDSWVSPSGGTVDFIVPGQKFPSGGRSPKSINANPDFVDTDFPVADWVDLVKLKLNSVREKDLADVIALVRAMGRVPSPTELGSLNGDQRDNLDLVKKWFQLRPSGQYGE